MEVWVCNPHNPRLNFHDAKIQHFNPQVLVINEQFFTTPTSTQATSHDWLVESPKYEKNSHDWLFLVQTPPKISNEWLIFKTPPKQQLKSNERATNPDFNTKLTQKTLFFCYSRPLNKKDLPIFSHKLTHYMLLLLPCYFPLSTFTFQY